MRPILFYIGDTPVPSFWTTAFLAFVVGFLLVRSDVRRRGFGADLTYDIVLYAYIGGWVGARLFLIPTAWSLFTTDPLGFLLSGSGWVWYGGIIGGAVAIWTLADRRKLPFLLFGDITAPALAMGLAIGRIGCQLSGDGDYGVPTDLPWGMAYPEGVVPTTDRVHPTPIYEMLACFAIFAYLWRRRWQNPPLGDIFARYLILSAVARFLIELVRRNPGWLLGFTTAQAISVGMVIIGWWLLGRAARPQSAAMAPEPDTQAPG
jgi:phosphatidylglycerol:prolipoprotein diacylglycerol transferase